VVGKKAKNHGLPGRYRLFPHIRATSLSYALDHDAHDGPELQVATRRRAMPLIRPDDAHRHITRSRPTSHRTVCRQRRAGSPAPPRNQPLSNQSRQASQTRLVDTKILAEVVCCRCSTRRRFRRKRARERGTSHRLRCSATRLYQYRRTNPLLSRDQSFTDPNARHDGRSSVKVEHGLRWVKT